MTKRKTSETKNHIKGHYITILICFSSCQWDSYSYSLPNDYRVSWADLPSNRNISKEKGGVRISPHVYEVGYNKKYIIAKQHPRTGTFPHEVTNTSKINYFILRMETDGSQTEQIWGPLTEIEFLAMTQELNIQNIKFKKKYKVDDN